MGIGRRAFLKYASLAVAGLAVDPLQAVVTNENVYLNRKMGILFEKPPAWGFIKVKDFGKLKSEQIIGKGWTDSVEETWEEIGDPLCIATKYYEQLPEHKGILSPTITLNVSHKSEYEGFGTMTLEEIIDVSAYGTSLLLKDFKILKRYDLQMISGCKFYEFDAEYMFEHIDIPEPLKVELKVLKAEHNDFFYDFNCHQSSAQNQTAEKEFLAFKQSIKLI